MKRKNDGRECVTWIVPCKSIQCDVRCQWEIQGQPTTTNFNDRLWTHKRKSISSFCPHCNLKRKSRFWLSTLNLWFFFIQSFVTIKAKKMRNCRFLSTLLLCECVCTVQWMHLSCVTKYGIRCSSSHLIRTIRRPFTHQFVFYLFHGVVSSIRYFYSTIGVKICVCECANNFVCLHTHTHFWNVIHSYSIV